MDDQQQILLNLREFVQDNFLYMRPKFEFGDDDSLLRKGVIDSLGIMEVVGFIEERWDLTVPPGEVTEQNFGSLSALARFVAAQRGVGAG